MHSPNQSKSARKSQTMKPRSLPLASVFGALSAHVYVRSGYAGEESKTFFDTKETVHTAIVRKGFLWHELNVYKNCRTDQFIYDFQQPTANFELDMAVCETSYHYKPIHVRVIPYAAADELNQKLKAARKPREGNLQQRKLEEKIELLQIIKDF